MREEENPMEHRKREKAASAFILYQSKKYLLNNIERQYWYHSFKKPEKKQML